MLVLHVNWADGALRLWAESSTTYEARTSNIKEEVNFCAPFDGLPGDESSPATAVAEQSIVALHDFALPPDQLSQILIDRGLVDADCLKEVRNISLSLPCDDNGPRPSDRLTSAMGPAEIANDLRLGKVQIPTVALSNDQAIASALRLEDVGPSEGLEFGRSLRYWITVARFALELIVDQRFIPTLVQPRDGNLQAAWHLWLHDEAARTRVSVLLAAMPPIARAIDVDHNQPWRVLNDALRTLTDSTIRKALIDEEYIEATHGRDAAQDPHVAWCEGLLDRSNHVDSFGGSTAQIVRTVRKWIDQLDETGRGRDGFHLCFELQEPVEEDVQEGEVSGLDSRWCLKLLLLSDGEPLVTIEADQVWSGSPTAQTIEGRRLVRPHEFMLAELGRASGIYPKIESALTDSQPSSVDLDTTEAVQFLREYRPILEDSGFKVIAPEWWDQPTGRLGVRLQIDSDPLEDDSVKRSSTGSVSNTPLGLDALVQYRWQLSVGDHALSLEHLQRLTQMASPLVRIGKQWVEIRPEDLEKAKELFFQNESGEVTLGRALRFAQGLDEVTHGLPVLGTQTTGWVSELFDLDGHDTMKHLEQPEGFIGELRPYQATGLSWLVFLERYGLGACLADDMGLGKTIQLIALLIHERNTIQGKPGPTLLVVPTSVVGNWAHELERFSPSLSFHIHHGPERPLGDEFIHLVSNKDVIITTYALVPRDQETLNKTHWHRVVLDEAQYVKNPPTQQATAIRSLSASRRIAMTGTPVENRLTELWSIMEFCNPGYLGTSEDFRRRFAVPIERHRDKGKADALRDLIGPFILRRLKSDPKVIVDLPPCIETKEYATLSAEQTKLYQAIVDKMLTSVDEADGIRRKGLILATLTRLKQVCNHPANLLRAENSPQIVDVSTNQLIDIDTKPLSSRSGKCTRLMKMLEELVAVGDRALLFTQYRRMGDLLESMIRHDLDCEVLYMHGGTPQQKRQKLIDKFQSSGLGAAVFILSLKAGGVGLNLTAANHVFHFDRWWNPAVEKQATDRAFRIGQTRTVHVHKFVCMGTLEEQIDQMIEQKMELADNILGSGEGWITELSTQQLRDVLRLRGSAMEVQ